MAITYTPARQRTFVAHGRGTDGSMDVDSTSSMEPPRKRTHYEANTDMDWEPHPVPRPSAMFSSSSARSSNNMNSSGTAASGPSAHSRAFLSSASSTSPFLFHTSAMQVDEPLSADPSPPPVASTSTSNIQPDHVAGVADTNNNANTAAQARDIANGAVQRERRKRDHLKNWQVSKGKGVQVDDEDGDEKDEDDNTVDEVDTSFMDSLSLTAPLKGLLRRTRSSRRRGEHAPLHLSLHNHNYHWPANGHEPFQFGSLSANSNPPSTNSPVRPSGWWHSDMPYVLLGYLQFTFNASLILLSLYLLLSFLMLLQHDVSERVSEYSIELQQEIMHCSSQYISNRCQPGERVPAMENMCKQWEFCMNKDPKVVNKLRVAAEIVAEVVNGFVEVISWRTMIFLLATLFIIVAYTNRTITTYRHQYSHDPSAKLYDPSRDQHSLASIARSSSENATKAPMAGR